MKSFAVVNSSPSAKWQAIALKVFDISLSMIQKFQGKNPPEITLLSDVA